MTMLKLLLPAALVLLSACGSVGPHRHAQDQGTEKPVWINNPGEGVSASAGFHVRGAQAQEELAVTRARDEYAKRYGVKVSSESATSQVVTGDRMSSVSTKDIHEEVDHKEGKATVKAKWRDPDTDVLWIWLVPAK